MKKFEDILVQCIEDIKAGRASIEDCLNRHPSLREQLEPLLRVALAIREPPDVKPSLAFKAKARVWIMDRIRDRQTATKWPWARLNGQVKPITYIRRFSTSMAGVILAIILAVSAVGAGTAYASQASLPGDTLYSVKLATEQAGMMLVRDDVARAERALSFANKRVREMEALAEKGRPQDLDLAVEKYGYTLNMILAEIEQAGDRGLATESITALVAEATARHLLMLDDVWGMVPNEAKTAIAHARNVSETGRENALAALAKDNPVKATGMNLAAMKGRLNRIRTQAEHMEAVEYALQQFEAMSEFGEEISQIAQQAGKDIERIEELIAMATSEHLEELAEAWEIVPEQAQPAIERVMANLQIRHQRRVQALEQWGVETPAPPVISERMWEQVEQRIREQEEEMTQEHKEGMSSGTKPSTQGVPAGAGHQYGPGTM